MADPLFGVHGKALEIRSQRLAMLASNIANAATPNYKARDIDFQKALSDAVGSSGLSAAEAAQSHVGFRVPLENSLDGNTVELSTEQNQFAENALQYKTTLSFLEGRIGTVMQALKGE
jgi:flagellar basal-body rod protein FlgB